MASFFQKIGQLFGAKPVAPKEEQVKVVTAPPKVKKFPRRPIRREVSPSIDRSKELLLQAEKQASQLLAQAQAHAREVERDAEETRKKVLSQEAELSRRLGALEEREKSSTRQQEQLAREKQEVENLKKEQLSKLEKIGSLTRDQAKDLILKGVEKRLADDIASRVQAAEEEVKSRSDEKVKEILSEAMQRGATDYVVEYTVSAVKLEDEEMKGRIIGREGRNIRSFEQATGVEIELDESNEITLSSFDPVRREIARRALEKLIRDRRIRPSLIEELVEKTKAEMDKILFEEGEKICHQAGVFRLSPEVVRLIGRYKFRFSYGQNLVAHTLEVVKIAVALANEIGANVNVVRLGALLHDIGKVITEQEGTHVELGVDYARKKQFPAEVVACIAEHHEDKPFSSPESRIIWVADAISGARPGARYEAHEEYLKRMKEVEAAASKFDGVDAVYAYQAGREVRVLVKPEIISDNEMITLTQKIRQELEEKVTYVGQVKITCIRETRSTETTKGH